MMKTISKHIVLGVILTILPQATFAQSNAVSEATAQSRAEAFMSKLSGKTKSVVLERTNTASGAKRLAKKTNAAEPYYIYNSTDGKGYVVVSGDERTVPVLGYSTSGQLDIDSLPEGLQDLLNQYQAEIEYINEHSSEIKAPAKTAANLSRHAIEPLLKTEWGQGSPYNLVTPEKSLTGCVATAAAQIMDYHRWPSGTTKEIPAYTTYTNSYNVPALEPTTFDWDRISHFEKGYTETPSDEDKNEVSKLMYYYGASVEMDYTPSESGAATDKAFNSLKDYFDYDCFYLDRNSKSGAYWEDILYNELEQGRPIYYSGYMNSGIVGHAWVCDGYDGEGRFHMNFGWDGSENGYFVTDALSVAEGRYTWPEDSYNIYQAIIGGIRPSGTSLSANDQMEVLLKAVDDYEELSVDNISLEGIKVENDVYSSASRYDKITITFHNSGNKDYYDQFCVSGTQYQGAGSRDMKFVDIPAGESKDVEFWCYGDNCSLDILSTNGFYKHSIAQYWTDENTYDFIWEDQNIEKYSIPENAVAAYLTSFDNVIPNSNPNTIYFIRDPYSDVPESFTGHNIVQDQSSKSIKLDNQHNYAIPFDIKVKEITVNATLSTSHENAFVLPFAASLPNGVTARRYNGNENGKIYYKPADYIDAYAPCLLSTNTPNVEFKAENVTVEHIYNDSTTFFPLSHRYTYNNSEADKGYVYDDGNNFVYKETYNKVPFSYIFYDNSGSNTLNDIAIENNTKNILEDKIKIATQRTVLFINSQEYKYIESANYDVNAEERPMTYIQFYLPYHFFIGDALFENEHLVQRLAMFDENSAACTSFLNINSDIANGTYQLRAFIMPYVGAETSIIQTVKYYDVSKNGSNINISQHIVPNLTDTLSKVNCLTLAPVEENIQKDPSSQNYTTSIDVSYQIESGFSYKSIPNYSPIDNVFDFAILNESFNDKVICESDNNWVYGGWLYESTGSENMTLSGTIDVPSDCERIILSPTYRISGNTKWLHCDTDYVRYGRGVYIIAEVKDGVMNMYNGSSIHCSSINQNIEDFNSFLELCQTKQDSSEVKDIIVRCQKFNDEAQAYHSTIIQKDINAMADTLAALQSPYLNAKKILQSNEYNDLKRQIGITDQLYQVCTTAKDSSIVKEKNDSYNRILKEVVSVHKQFTLNNIVTLTDSILNDQMAFLKVDSIRNQIESDRHYALYNTEHGEDWLAELQNYEDNLDSWKSSGNIDVIISTFIQKDCAYHNFIQEAVNNAKSHFSDYEATYIPEAEKILALLDDQVAKDSLSTKIAEVKELLTFREYKSDYKEQIESLNPTCMWAEQQDIAAVMPDVKKDSTEFSGKYAQSTRPILLLAKDIFAKMTAFKDFCIGWVGGTYYDAEGYTKYKADIKDSIETNYTKALQLLVDGLEDPTYKWEGTFNDAEVYAQTSNYLWDVLNYKRTFYSNGYNALFVPFSIPAKDLTDCAIYKLAYFRYNDSNHPELKISRLNDDEMVEANTPYLIKYTGELTDDDKMYGKSITFSLTDITTLPADTTAFDCIGQKFVGTYHGIDSQTAYANCYVNLYRSGDWDTYSNIEPQRWYITLDPSNWWYISTGTEEIDYIPGDVDDDKEATIADLAKLIYYTQMNDWMREGTFNKINADTNRDGKIDIDDITALKNILLLQPVK